ncbi:ribosomal protein S18-alanine N-acetyltransferase [Microbacterium halophytorum]|uniref:ribosomal protein S18-alanine N-acetyltransferase n=1 Tax=Microbacterium halophytorum TaxID=2067568 RepID=UPI000CFBA40A|nr:ribosomal protein S18-alanine N-acetyltransferase [Microbacterium halophytorum]
MAIERASFPTDAWSEPMMADELSGAHGHYLVAERGGEVIGYGGLRALAGASDGDIQTIALAAAARGAGLGRSLLRALIAEADARRVREVFLEVRADNDAARTLYASEGFEEIGTRPHYYQPDDVDAIVMKIDVPRWRRRDTVGSGASA